jgi:hypothetical protein
MTGPRDPDAIIANWLEDGPIDLPDETRRAIVVGLRTQPRARQMAFLRGLPIMNSLSRLAAAAAIVLAVGGLSIFVLSNRNSGGPGAQPSATTGPSVAPSASVVPSPSTTPGPLDTATWKQYVSNRYGFSISYPADWVLTPARRDWTLAVDAKDFLGGGADHFELQVPNQGVGVNAWSVAVEPGTTAASWLDSYCQLNTKPCTGLDQRSIPAQIDGHAGVIVAFTDDVQAFFLVDGRMYVVACWRPNDDPSVAKYSGAIKLVQTYLSTMHLLPGGPASAAPTSPGPS